MKRREITIRISQEFEPKEGDLTPEETAEHLIDRLFYRKDSRLNINIIESKDVNIVN